MEKKKFKTTEEIVEHCLKLCCYFNPACIMFTMVEASWCFSQTDQKNCPMLKVEQSEH